MRPLFQLFVKHVIVTPNVWVSGMVFFFSVWLYENAALLFLPPHGANVGANQVAKGAANAGANHQGANAQANPNGNANANPNVNAPHAEQPQGQEQINNFENFNAFHNNYNVFEYLR